MKLTIDNLDGSGAVDYSATVVSSKPLRIARQLNEPSVCTFTLIPGAASLSTPTRHGRLIVSDDNGVVLFTGYVATEPALELAGQGIMGPVYEAFISAISDDVLLDLQTIPRTMDSYGQTVAQLAQTLTQRVDPVRINTAGLSSTAAVGQFTALPGESWSKNIGRLASMARSAYRVAAETLSLTPVGEVIHSLSETDGTLQVKALQASMAKMLANDVTLCGESEPSAYVVEFFQGDGTTVLFELTAEPFVPSTAKAKPLIDLFQTPEINPLLWQVQDAASHLSITAAGLTCTGGNGIDGNTAVMSLDQLEMAGSLVLEAGGVQLSAGSQGILHALYSGTVELKNCFAGFQVSQANGGNAISAVVNGAVAGASFVPIAGHLYTLRLRTYAKEMQRVLQSYYSVDDNGLNIHGGTTVDCSVNLVFEVQDMTGGVSGVVTVLYDGFVSAVPPVCTYGILDSYNLQCSINSVQVTQEGPVWVTSVPPGGGAVTRRIGTTAQGAECKIERTGKLRFYPTNIPQAGELITVFYRTKRQSVARLASAASIAQEGSNPAIPGTSQWMGTVTSPAARSSVDCENAALALLDLATSRGAAWKGTYTGWNLEAQADIWPGDVLAIAAASSNLNANLVVRSVQIEISCTAPELTKYTIQFANDWADDLAMKLSSHVPTTAWLPQQPETAVSVLANLLTLAVSSVSTSAIQISTGVAPPTGGGFEVRRRDWAFGPGTGSDLVLRSPVGNFSIPREAAMERYYIRMYDGATPPNYSRFSNAVFVNVPL